MSTIGGQNQTSYLASFSVTSDGQPIPEESDKAYQTFSNWDLGLRKSLVDPRFSVPQQLQRPPQQLKPMFNLKMVGGGNAIDKRNVPQSVSQTALNIDQNERLLTAEELNMLENEERQMNLIDG
jgi:hypothetical protein